MGRFIIFFLSFSLFFCISLECPAAERVKQEIKGNQNPTVFNTPDSTTNITYNTYNAAIDQVLAEIKKESSKCLDFISAFQSKKLEELNITLAKLLVKNEGIPEEDAKKWASDIIEKSPKFKQETENNKAMIRKYNEELSKNVVATVYKAFVYIFETVDSKFLALKELSPKATYEKAEKFILFSDETTKIEPYMIRSFVLAKGNRIAVILKPGNLAQGIMQECPYIYFFEYKGEKSFNINPEYGGGKTIWELGDGGLKKEKTLSNITYSATGTEILTDNFKEQLNKVFTEFIQLAFIQ